MESLDHIRDEILRLIRQATSRDALEQVRIAALGRKGRITELMKEPRRTLDGEARRERGAALNRLKDEVEDGDRRMRSAGSRTRRCRRGSTAERIDVTLPVRAESEGRIHPISQTIDEIVAIFGEMGFSVAEGPDIEDDFHNFTALNIPPEHPARQEQDTFYLAEQKPTAAARCCARIPRRCRSAPCRRQKPPIRIIVPGRTFRSDHDATHSPMFHQVEGPRDRPRRRIWGI